MIDVETVLTAIQTQTRNLGNTLVADMTENRRSPVEMVEVPAGVLLCLIAMTLAAQEDIKMLVSRIRAADLPDNR